ncbi:MAG: N-formylglutamate amidohydrolase [Chloroflexi bacterium]|nr:N-formylglutamate amidohydrolase [Chloroflexota bacterium]
MLGQERSKDLNCSATPLAILHIPHASRTIPPEVRESLAMSDAELEDELRKVTDAYTDSLFACDRTAARRIVFRVSRLVVDPERFENDSDEPMSARGMGVVYTRTLANGDLRKHLSQEEKASLIARYYYPHHKRLGSAVRSALRSNQRCLIIDCHSFSSVPFPPELDQTPRRPDICIGTDQFHTPQWLARLAVGLFSERGFQVYLNRPFSGALVPQPYCHVNSAVWSVMIEINRRLYMDEQTGRHNHGFHELKSQLQEVLSSLISRAGTPDGWIPEASPAMATSKKEE